MVTRAQRLRKEIRDGESLQKMAEMLYGMANDPGLDPSDRVGAAREWRQVMKDLTAARPAAGRSVKDDLAAKRDARRRAGG